MFYDVFEKLCAEKGVKPGRAADEIGISRATVTNWKKNGYSPRRNILEKIAQYFSVSVDTLLDQYSPETQKAPALNKRDERDIKEKMEEMLDLFNSDDALMFDGEPLDDETRQLLKDSYENQLRMTKALAKEKYTPNKYKNQ